jgi:hypothetical protein
MQLVVHWCYTLGVVRSIDRLPIIECCGPVWSFTGWITQDFPPADGYSVRSFVQGQFQYSLPWFGGGKAPWIAIVVHGDGSYDWMWG